MLERLLNEYDNAISPRQCSLDDAITFTEQLVEALEERLWALHGDRTLADEHPDADIEGAVG
jgi:hypothetical protein